MVSLTLCRFLGLLHMEVFHQRLDQEYGASIITTTPTVPYTLRHTDGSVEEIQNPSQVSQPCALEMSGLTANQTFAQSQDGWTETETEPLLHTYRPVIPAFVHLKKLGQIRPPSYSASPSYCFEETGPEP